MKKTKFSKIILGLAMILTIMSSCKTNNDMETKNLQKVLDRQEIEQLLYRLTRSFDRRDAELMKSCYWPEAVEELEDIISGSFQYNGNAHEFVPMAMQGFGYFNRTFHRLSNILIELDGDKANAETYIVAYHQFTDKEKKEQEQFVGARQLYKFEKRNGEWRIMHRLSMWEFNQNQASTAMWIDLEKVNPRYISKRDKSDVSYKFLKK
ncbi:MAG: nuclear transport factor 2 family protein [Marinifilaceae bacterium]|jgi:hypothetical protein|nr:nuclear transport factor 2 family protein [Marinifilaceae bacterium]